MLSEPAQLVACQTIHQNSIKIPVAAPYQIAEKRRRKKPNENLINTSFSLSFSFPSAFDHSANVLRLKMWSQQLLASHLPAGSYREDAGIPQLRAYTWTWGRRLVSKPQHNLQLASHFLLCPPVSLSPYCGSIPVNILSALEPRPLTPLLERCADA